MGNNRLLQIHLLGDLRIVKDGKPFHELRSRKAQALLVYLACTGKSHSREVLATLFWEESSQHQAMSNLRDVLHLLRKHLGPFITITRYSTAINPEADIWVDAVEMNDAIQDFRKRAVALTQETADLLEEALTLYQGDFLAGFYIHGAGGFEEWAINERERIRLEILDILLALIHFHKNNLNVQKGIDFARRAINLEPLMEVGYQHLMCLLDYSGRSSEALILYGQCKQILELELGVEPSEETQDLYLRLIKGERLPGFPTAQMKHNLPLPLPDLIGRKEDLIKIAAHLQNPHGRLLTLVGIGGIGKTSLSLHAAASELDHFPDGVWLVELASFSDLDFLPDYIAETFGVSAQESRTGLGVTDILVEHLQNKKLLLLLDNCEHLIEPCAAFTEVILKGCLHLKVLATSREPLGIPGEQLYQVEPLSIPAEDTASLALGNSASEQLFMERAGKARPGFVSSEANTVLLGEICRQLDGIPLAIELAAARVKMLTLDQIAERLQDRFILLTGGPRRALLRHQTLLATMDWSYHLLPEEERRLMRRLAVFSGGWSIEGAEEVASHDGIAKESVLDLQTQLIDKCLVNVLEQRHTIRFTMLETVRQYGLERLLDAGEVMTTRRGHAAFYAQVAEQADEGLRDHRQMRSLAVLDLEHDNLRGALRWAIDHGEADLAFRLVGALGWYWFMRGHWKESQKWLRGALDLEGGQHSEFRARAIYRAGGLELIRGNVAGNIERMKCTAEQCRQAGDMEGLAWCLNLLGQGRTWKTDDFKVAEPYLLESRELFKSLDDEWGVAWSLRYLGQVYEVLGDYKRGKAVQEKGISIFEQIGDTWNTAHSYYLFGTSAFRHSDFLIAKMAFEECLVRCGIIADKVMEAHALRGLAQLALKLDEIPKAERIFDDALESLLKIGDEFCAAVALRDLAEVKQIQGQHQQTRKLLRQSLHSFEKLDHEEGIISVITRFASLAIAAGEGARAARLLAVGGKNLKEDQDYIYPTFKEEHAALVTAAHNLIGDEKYELYYAEGAAMDLPEAMDYALA